MACEHPRPSELSQGCTWCAREGGAATERARIVALLRAMAAQRDAEAEAVLARCPDAFAMRMGGERLKMIERERAAIAYHQFADAGNELRRAADRIESGET